MMMMIKVQVGDITINMLIYGLKADITQLCAIIVLLSINFLKYLSLSRF